MAWGGGQGQNVDSGEVLKTPLCATQATLNDHDLCMLVPWKCKETTHILYVGILVPMRYPQLELSKFRIRVGNRADQHKH